MSNKYLKYLNIFGNDIKLKYKENNQIKTKTGLFFSFIMIFISIILSCLLGQDIFYKKDPFSYTEMVLSDMFEPKKLNNKKFPFSLAVMDFNSGLLNYDSYLNLEMRIVKTYISGNSTITEYIPLKINQCSPNNFPQLNINDYYNSGLNSTLCTNVDDIILEGFWGENIIIYLELSVYMCDYYKFPDYCKNHYEIVEFISKNGINLNLYYLDTAITVRNYTDPIKKYVNNLYKYFDSEKWKICEFHINNEYLITDDILFFDSERIDENFKLVEFLCDSIDIDLKAKKLMSFLIYSSNVSVYYYRKYIKISDILGKISGVLQLLYFIFKLISDSLTNITVNQKYIKKLFYQENDFDINIIGKDLIRSTCLIKISQSIETNLITNNAIRNYNYNKYFINLVNRQNNIKLVIPIYQKILIIFNCKSKHNNKLLKYYDIAHRKIKNYMDIVNLIHNLREIYLIKHLIMVENELKYFNLIKKVNLNENLLDENNDKIVLDEILNKIKSNNISNNEARILKLLNI